MTDTKEKQIIIRYDNCVYIANLRQIRQWAFKLIVNVNSKRVVDKQIKKKKLFFINQVNCGQYWGYIKMKHVCSKKKVIGLLL